MTAAAAAYWLDSLWHNQAVVREKETGFFLRMLHRIACAEINGSITHTFVLPEYLWHLPNKHKRCLSEQTVLNHPVVKSTRWWIWLQTNISTNYLSCDRLLVINKYKDICIHALTLCTCCYCTFKERKRACQLSRTCMRWLAWSWYLIRAPSFLFKVTAVLRRTFFWTSQQASDEDGTRSPSSQLEKLNAVKNSLQSP